MTTIGETVLDLGSGFGCDALLAARAAGPRGRVTGVDLSAREVESARALAASPRFGLDAARGLAFVVGDVEALPLPDASVDVVVSNGAFCLVPDKPRAFREVLRARAVARRGAVDKRAPRFATDASCLSFSRFPPRGRARPQAGRPDGDRVLDAARRRARPRRRVAYLHGGARAAGNARRGAAVIRSARGESTAKRRAEVWAAIERPSDARGGDRVVTAERRAQQVFLPSGEARAVLAAAGLSEDIVIDDVSNAAMSVEVTEDDLAALLEVRQR